MDTFVLSLVVIIYLLLLIGLGWLGFKHTRNTSDYLIGGRQIHPFIMAMSYGATFISSSAIVGFGGISANFGMGLMWLNVLNMSVGIIIAFIFFGRKTRQMGHKLNAHTFPEFLGNRYNSRTIQIIAGSIIFIAMPLYAAVVLKGGAVFIEHIFEIDYNIALFIFTLVIASYVITGGLKGVMYTDALQGVIMVVSIMFLLIWTYKKIGMGFVEANRELTSYASMVPEKLAAAGHQGWTAMPKWGSPWWYSLVTSLVMGVGIGVLAQPQLVVRFMTVKSNKELNRAILIGTLFIFVCTGFIFTIGPLSNIFFMQNDGKMAMALVGDVDKIIPVFIKASTPGWFSAIFMLCILSASMSTLSSQFHVMGTSIGRDVVKGALKSDRKSTRITRYGIAISIIVSYVICYVLKDGVIAKGTTIFFGICAATFLPAYFSALYWEKANRASVKASMLSGLVASLFCLVFVHASEAKALGICKALTGRDVLFPAHPWPSIDPMLIALPISIIVLVLMVFLTQKKAVTA
jgi:solute:Na+ symporter, SSS family